MISQITFIAVTIITFGFLSYSFSKVFKVIKSLKKPYSISNFGERIVMTLKVVFGQTKIFRFPIIGLMHALVFWGFILIVIGSGEMLLDGILGVPFDNLPENDRSFSVLGTVYDFIMAGGDVSAFVILLTVSVFIFRRLFLNIKRFSGEEVRHKDHKDATFALFLILFLMITLLGMNIGYVANATASGHEIYGIFPVSSYLSTFFISFSAETLHIFELTNWWSHILLIFFFANYLPFSKHFHVFMSIPNVYFSRTEPLTKMNNMKSVTAEVELMMNPDAPLPEEDPDAEPERFGMKDVGDGTWKNYIDSLACTQCGRCTSVCPANLTGKKLSPRKVVLDYRRRTEEKMSSKTKDVSKELYPDYTSYEELWACTTCNACSQECPINIDHPSMILEMRRYIFMEEAAAPSLINSMSSNIENNGAPWQYSVADRFNWASDLFPDTENKQKISVPLMSDLAAQGKNPEYLFWVGSAGSYDDRAKKITRSFVKILDYAKVDYACLGTEETDSGDNAKRAGNEFLFQMQAMQIIEILKGYGIKKIVTCDPHEYNTIKNEYPELGADFEIIHHSKLISDLISDNKIQVSGTKFEHEKITFHDPCYLGRGNNEYKNPRLIIKKLTDNFTEPEKTKSRSLCCGAGGTQMFKEAEKGDKEIYELRTEELLKTSCNIIATACPMCATMITDGTKMKEKEEIKVLDIAELIALSLI